MKILKNGFVRNIVLLASGTAGAQIITILFSPLITRIYGPEEFGLLGAFQSVLSMFAPIAALTYPIAIVLQKTDDNARAVAKLSVVVAISVAISFMFAIAIYGDKFVSALNLVTIYDFLTFVPIAMFFSATQDVMQQWMIRKGYFNISAKTAISQSFFINIIKVIFGWFHSSAIVLVVITAIGNGFYAAQLWLASNRWCKHEDRLIKNNSIKIKIMDVACENKDFPLYRAPQTLLNSFSQALPTLVLISMFEPLVAGYFTLSKAILAAPSVLIGGSVTNVFYPKVVDIIRNKMDPLPLLIKSTVFIFAVASIPFSMVFIFGGEIFSFAFGDDWFVTGEYAKWMSLWLISLMALRPTIAIISALGIQKYFLFFEVLSVILSSFGLIMGSMFFNDPVMTIMIYSLISMFMCLFLFMFVVAYIHRGRH